MKNKIYTYIYIYIYKYYERKKGRNYIFPTSLFRESLHSYIYIYIYIYSVGDMNVREILTMRRPCPHQRHSSKETYTNSLRMI